MFGEAGQEEILQPGVEFLEIGRISTALLYNKDMLVGQDPTDVERIYQDMYRAFLACGSTGGIAVTAISGIEIALWDIAGKTLNAPEKICTLNTVLGK